MNLRRTFYSASALAILLSISSVAAAPSDEAGNTRDAAKYEADNTGKNARDVNDDRKTADSQDLTGNNTEIVAKIRREIMENDELSTYGKNVKIIVEDGSVTLRGPVKNAQERSWIASAAADAAPKLKVVNQLEVDAG